MWQTYTYNPILPLHIHSFYTKTQLDSILSKSHVIFYCAILYYLNTTDILAQPKRLYQYWEANIVSKIKRSWTQNLPKYSSRFILQAIIRIDRREILCLLLIDCEATKPILMEEWVKGHRILIKKCQKPIKVQNTS